MALKNKIKIKYLENHMNSIVEHDISNTPTEQPAYARLFSPEKLTVGLILPLETHPDSPAPTMRDHVAMAQKADELGFAALWMRDVPFYDPYYGDVGQVFDPIPYMAYLAAFTQRIALGTAGIVLPMREPLLLAKQVASIDQLSGGRMVLGLSSGDRPAEYPLFGIDFETRGDRFRDAYHVLKTVLDENFPSFSSPRFGSSTGTHELIPKPSFGALPTIAVGQAQQSLAYIAENMDGFIGSAPVPQQLQSFAKRWHDLVSTSCGPERFKPLGIGGFLDLVGNQNEPFSRTRGGIRSGSKSLVHFLHEAQATGVNHIALNPKVSRRPYSEIMDELAAEVLPQFPSN
jgi:luciferase-type oxidoreductase